MAGPTEPPPPPPEARADGPAAPRPFTLDDPTRMFRVRRGHLDIFAVGIEDGEVVDRRIFVARVPAGGAAFGLPPAANRRTMLAVPSLDAVLDEADRAALATDGDFDLNEMVRVERWVFALSEFMAAGHAPPRDIELLEADPDIPYGAGAASAHHQDLLWVTASRPIRLNGRPELEVATGAPPLPLCERAWVTFGDDTRISAAHTPSTLVDGLLWPALDRFGELVLEHAAVLSADRVAAGRERHMRSRDVHLAAGTRMFHDLGQVLDSGPDEPAARPAAHSPQQAAAGLVAAAAGVALDAPPDIKDGDPLVTVPALARRAGVRTRRIEVRPGWWRRDGPSFFGLVDGRPVAAVADGRGSYRTTDGTTGEPVDDPGSVGPHGLMFYASIPDHVANGLQALLHTLRGRGPDIRTVVAMAVLAGVAAVLTPIVTGELLARIVPRVDTSMWLAALGALLLAALGSATFEIVRAIAVLRLEGRAEESLQAGVWNRLLSLPVGFFRDYTAGDLADRANGVSEIRRLLTGATTTAIVGGVFSVFSYALMFYYSWQLALCAGAVLLVLVAATWIFARLQMGHYRTAFRVQGLIDGFVFQMITGLAKLRMANAENDALARWAERFAEQRSETLAARRWAAAQLAFNSMFTPLAMLALFAFIWYALLEGGAQPGFGLGDFLSSTSAFGQFAGAVVGLTSAWSTVVAVVPLFERVQPILDARPETTGGGTDLRDITGRIEFAGVSFRYLPDVPNAVDDVSFRIEPGDHVAFVGASGSGKSTIYRLLLGFEQPDAGTVLLDGHDLSSLDLPSVRQRMGVVLQNGRLSASTIFKNIAGASPLSMDDAWEAARLVGLDDDIRAMPMGMHTILTEGATDLSGGQRQRLLIAGALARRPRVVLFDEATSALDNYTQAIVQEALKGINATRVVIAHRLSTITDADRIYVLERGRIVETGRYEELLQAGGAFAALARRQMV